MSLPFSTDGEHKRGSGGIVSRVTLEAVTGGGSSVVKLWLSNEAGIKPLFIDVAISETEYCGSTFLFPKFSVAVFFTNLCVLF